MMKSYDGRIRNVLRLRLIGFVEVDGGGGDYGYGGN